MFKQEVAQRSARVMGNVIRGKISKKDHELLTHYLWAPRSVSPQEVNWHVNTQKFTDLTREMRASGVTGDGYQNFKDVMRGIRLVKGKKTFEDHVYEEKTEKIREALEVKGKLPINEISFRRAMFWGQVPLDDYHGCHNNHWQSWKQAQKRWGPEYERRSGEKPFLIGFHTSIGDLRKGDTTVPVKDVSNHDKLMLELVKRNKPVSKHLAPTKAKDFTTREAIVPYPPRPWE